VERAGTVQKDVKKVYIRQLQRFFCGQTTLAKVQYRAAKALMPVPAGAAKPIAKGILIITKLRHFSGTKAIVVRCITFKAAARAEL